MCKHICTKSYVYILPNDEFSLRPLQQSTGEINCGRALTGHCAGIKKTEIHPMWRSHNMSAGKKTRDTTVHNMLSFVPKIDMYVCAEEIIGSIYQKLLAGVERQESWTEKLTFHQFISYYLNLVWLCSCTLSTRENIRNQTNRPFSKGTPISKATLLPGMNNTGSVKERNFYEST